MFAGPARVLAAMLLVALLAGCGEEDPSRPVTRPGTVTIDDEAATDRGTANVAAGEDLEIEAGDFYFAPTVITGPGGDDVDITVANLSGTLHNLSIDEQSIDADVEEGATITVSARFPDAGTAVFYCSYHRDRGMLGVLVAS